MSALKLGKKISPEEARAYVSELRAVLRERWEQRVLDGEFMTLLARGTLPVKAMQIFFRNWGVFTIEINTLIAASYHKHIGFFKRHVDLLAPFGAKIADEFIHPEPPGHILIMFQTARALGLKDEQILLEPMLPEARGELDFKRSLLWEGTVAEWWASLQTEELIGHWSGSWYKALTTHYGLDHEQAIYFAKHEEADLREHEGTMGHGSFNRAVLQRILEEGYGDERAGYGVEYCALTAVDLYGVMHDAALKAEKNLGGRQRGWLRA